MNKDRVRGVGTGGAPPGPGARDADRDGRRRRTARPGGTLAFESFPNDHDHSIEDSKLAVLKLLATAPAPSQIP